MNDNWHPDELDLVDLVVTGSSRPEVEQHVRGCEDCLQDLTLLSRAEPDRVGLRSEAPNGPVTPTPGQVWRVRWGDVAELVIILVVDTDRDEVEVVPVMDASVQVPGRTELEHLGSGLAAWAMRSTLPVRVLDRCADELPEDQLRDLVANEPSSRAAVSDVFTPGALEAADIVDRLEYLADATWMPAAIGTPVHEQLIERFTTPGGLAAALQITPGRARQILQGAAPINSDELETLRSVAPEVTGDVAIDPDVAWAMDQPDVRPLWEAAAAAAGTSDSGAFRWQMFTSGNFALAARTTAAHTRREQALIRVKAALSGRT